MKDAVRIHKTMTRRDWGLLLFLSVLWGGSFFFNEVALAELPPLTLVLLRVALAAAILRAVMRLKGIAMPRDPAIWRAFLAMGLLNNAIPFSLIVWGQSHVASGVAAIMNASTPLFTVLLAHRLTRDERLTAGRLVGVGLGLAGVAVMMGGAVAGGTGAALAGQVACLAAAFSYALAGVYGRRFGALGLPPLAVATGQVTASSLILLPLALLVDRPWTLAAPGAATLLALAGVAALSTALAYVLFFRLLAAAGATNLLLVTLLIPVTAILLGVAVLGETLLPRHLAGMALIGLGLAAIDGRPPAAAIRLARRGSRDSLRAPPHRVEREETL
ncbi:MAG TPA: DMT family transporter [Amaricoccus sp.]|uniref:DMT family transporter n=1 Tax=Amaricoccus sp. TaxID=1872485 RepID=UPI002BED666F|nr:DMT family transporter [Amaricoccus sp.]HMQ92475.1 DMT family transporter [Amaricoccus sp.]HMR53656.1 DMT family transporter [Amaricoccus sp.]HMR60791.1 DMT family transporter [Amaricoccus sp.]HMU00694.1 DMT family transporter [Amaricoccus sp.]